MTHALTASLLEKNDFVSLQWTEHASNPLIAPPAPSPLIADPTFVPPDASPDNTWHLFAHSLMGIHHFVSQDGIAWKRLDGLVSRVSMRPFLFLENSRYYLFYEKSLKALPSLHSRIEVRTSTDLYHWSAPQVILSPAQKWHYAGTPFGAMGNPCVVLTNEGYRLYFSAGLVILKDCGFPEPKYIGCANAQNLLGPYTPLSEPLIAPDANDAYVNLGAGAIKVLRVREGYVGFHNGIYRDAAIQHSGSAIRLLYSSDGYNWQPAQNEPLLKPRAGWTKSFVYACDVRPVGNQWYLYFNARDGWFRGSEHIGLAIGRKSD